jgi:hypothetical protein
MFDQIGPGVITVIGGIIGLTALAVAVSRNAQTPQVLTAGGSALAGIIGAAVAPVTGSSTGLAGNSTSTGSGFGSITQILGSFA